jgi:hypothetical protein
MLQNDKLDADDTEFETFDKYIGAEFLTKDNGELVPAKVVKGARDNEGKAIGKQHANPLMDTQVYDCELGRYSANVFAQWDNKKQRQTVLQIINDHRKGATAIHITNGYTVTKQGRRIPKKTTKGGNCCANGKMEHVTGCR